jgi:hypothetical protein
MSTESIFNLRLGESAFVGPIEFFRVPGGWLAFTIRGICFVPFHDNEFGEVRK